jgi:hypothetical protein
MKPLVDPVAIKKMMETTPSPGGSAIRQILRFGADQFDFLRCNSDALGDVFTLEMPREPLRIILGHPLDIKKVFALRHRSYS